MIVKNLRLRNFRNYEKTELVLNPGMNLITGENAQGKTNLLESLVVLSLTRSHRISSDKQMIRHEAEFAEIGCISRCASPPTYPGCGYPLSPGGKRGGRKRKNTPAMEIRRSCRLFDGIGHWGKPESSPPSGKNEYWLCCAIFWSYYRLLYRTYAASSATLPEVQTALLRAFLKFSHFPPSFPQSLCQRTLISRIRRFSGAYRPIGCLQ